MYLRDQIKLERIIKLKDHINWGIFRGNKELSFSLAKHLFNNQYLPKTISLSSFVEFTPDIPIQYIIDNHHLQWNWYMLLTKYHINDIIANYDIIKSRITQDEDIPFPYHIIHNDKQQVSFEEHIINPKLRKLLIFYPNNVSLKLASPELMTKYPDYPWCYFSASCSKYITLEFVEANLDKEWNWTTLSQTLNMSLKTVLEKPNLPWNYIALQTNDNLSLADIKYLIDHKYISIHNINIRSNKFNTLNELLHYFPNILDNIHPNFELMVAFHETLSLNDINILKTQYNAQIHSIWQHYNSNLTYDVVIANPCQYDWHQFLSLNTAWLQVSDDFLLQRAKQIVAARRIQKQWRKCITNPNYKICTKRLLMEFLGLLSKPH